MKKNAIFVNGSRGAVVDEEALYDALVNKEITGAGLDVYKQEPVEVEHPLLKLPNIVTIPHIGSGTEGNQNENGNACCGFCVKTICRGNTIYCVEQFGKGKINGLRVWPVA